VRVIGPPTGSSFIDRVRYYTRKSEMRLLVERNVHPSHVGANHRQLQQNRLKARRAFLKEINILV